MEGSLRSAKEIIVEIAKLIFAVIYKRGKTELCISLR